MQNKSFDANILRIRINICADIYETQEDEDNYSHSTSLSSLQS